MQKSGAEVKANKVSVEGGQYEKDPFLHAANRPIVYLGLVYSYSVHHFKHVAPHLYIALRTV